MTELDRSGRERLAEYLSEHAFGVIEEWMRIVDIDNDNDDIEPSLPARFQGRWSHRGDGEFTFGEHYQGDDTYGRYRLTVMVEPLPPLPPIGPE